MSKAYAYVKHLGSNVKSLGPSPSDLASNLLAVPCRVGIFFLKKQEQLSPEISLRLLTSSLSF